MVQKCVVCEKIRKRRRNLFFARLGVLNWHYNRSQSPVFGLAVLYPTGSKIWCFWYIKTRERKIAMEKTFLLYLSVHWGDVIEQIKKICHIHFKPGEHMNRSEIWSNIKRELLGLKWVGNTTRQLTPKREPWLHVGRGLFGVHLLTLHFNVVWFIILTILSLLYSSSWAEFFLTCSKLIYAKWPQVAQAHCVCVT